MNRWIPVLLVTLTVSLAIAEDAPRPLSLPEAIRLALKNNPDLATAQQHVNAARTGIQQTEAALWPQIRLAGSYTASDNPVQAFMMTLNQRAFSFAGNNFNHPTTTDNLNGKVLAHWSLYDGGETIATRQAAKFNTEAARQTFAAARNDLVFEVTRAFYTIGKTRQFVAVATAAVTSMEANVNVASTRFAAGHVLKTDFLDAQVRLAESQENLIRARNAFALSEIVFRSVLGVGESELVTATEHDITTNTPVPTSTSRPELAAARQMVIAADRQVRAAQAGYAPHLTAFASYDLDSGNGTRYAESWLAGVSVELNLFDGFLTRGKISEARANLESARQQERKVSLALSFETRQAQLNLEESQARCDTTSKSVAQAEESLQITKDRYTNGLALLTQVLDAETALTAARQRRAAAEADARIAHAALDHALGTTWKE